MFPEPDSTTTVTVPPKRQRSVITWLLDSIGSLRFGVTLLVILFVYSSIGSAGAPIGEGMLRPPFLLSPDAWVSIAQLRAFEMTEMEWFHWWPFTLLCGLICLSLTTATIRRIPFKPVNYGVWMIHSGIIVLAIGSVWYFATKIEGDTPIARRNVVVSLPGAEPRVMRAKLGNRVDISNGSTRYAVTVASIDPNWEILDEANAGERAYAVTLRVSTPERTFMRQVLANYPQYTEDIVPSGEPEQPMARARNVNANGNPLVDETLNVRLEYDPQEYFYVMHSSALYLRMQGEPTWTVRPIEGLPRYNDYVQSLDDVFLTPGDSLAPDPIDITVSAKEDDDPLASEDLRITGYLRYAQPVERRIPGGSSIDPAIRFEIMDAAGQSVEEQLIAFDPTANTALEGNLVFRWFDTATDYEAYVAPPTITVVARETGESVEIPVNAETLDPESSTFVPVGTSGVSVRLRAMQDNVPTSMSPDASTASVAIVEYRLDGETRERWVSSNPALTHDRIGPDRQLPEDGEPTVDARVVMTFERGPVLPRVTIAAGPDPDELRLVLAIEGPFAEVIPLTPGVEVEIRPSIFFVVRSYSAHTMASVKPQVVPRLQRAREVRRGRSMIQVSVPGALVGRPVWIGYNEFPFDSVDEALLRFPYDPTRVQLADGRVIELLFSRDRRRLPAPVALDDFVVTSHIGGFTGQTASIRNWTSRVTFQTDDEAWTDLYEVSVNEPAEHEGLSYFQASWDPPFQSQGFRSNGLNYTILGVGNRNGVITQLVGCCISVIGMMYAFYVKPIIKRRQRERVYREVADRRIESALVPSEETS